MLVAEGQSSKVLPSLRLIDFSVADLSYFISSLLIKGSFGPVLVKYYCIGSFEVEKESGLFAPWRVTNIGEDGSRESLSCEVIYK